MCGEKCTLKTNLINALITRLMTSCLSFGNEINYQVEHRFLANFLCRVMKLPPSTALGLDSLQTFSLMFITPLNFKCRT